MISLQHALKESLRIGLNDNPYQYHPKNLNELRELVDQRINEEEGGTETNPIDLNDIDVSNITDFYRLFIGTYAQQRMKYIDISDWDVSNCTNLSYMFINCENLVSVGDLGNWDVRLVDNTHSMFKNCTKLKYIGDLSNWNFNCLKRASMMFDNCYILESIGDISNWDMSNVESIGFMFEECKKLKNVGDLNKWKLSDKSINSYIHNSYIFAGCDDSIIPKWYSKKIQGITFNNIIINETS